MFGEWRVYLVLLVLWCGSRDVVSGGDVESLRPKYKELVGTGQGDTGDCGEAPDDWYERLSGLAGKSGDQMVKDTRTKAANGGEEISDEALVGLIKIVLGKYDVQHPKDKRCVVSEGLVCSGGKCVKCDKAGEESKTTCEVIKTIAEKEWILSTGKKSEGGRVKTPVGVVVVSLVIGFVFAL